MWDSLQRTTLTETYELTLETGVLLRECRSTVPAAQCQRQNENWEAHTLQSNSSCAMQIILLQK